MNNTTSTALAAEARFSRAGADVTTLPRMGAIALQPGFRPILRRDIMAAVNTCAKDLGLRPGTVAVLDALLSCLPCVGADGRDAPITAATLLTIYASNETLCFRAKGLTDRQLRRNLETLEAAGLLQRRDSANGKRFPIKRAGKVVGAFGLDLSPLFARSDELVTLAKRHREEAEEMRGLRAQILHLRAASIPFAVDQATVAFLNGLRNLLRRTSLTLLEARATLKRLTAVISALQKEADTHIDLTHSDETMIASVTQEIDQNTAVASSADAATKMTEQDRNTAADTARPTHRAPSDGQNVRHVEQESDTQKNHDLRVTATDWADLREVSAFYDQPTSARDYLKVAFEFGTLLRIDRDLLAKAVTQLGLWQLLNLEDRIAKAADRIGNTTAYLRAVMAT